MDIAPPAGLARIKDFDIFLNIYVLNAYCSPFHVFLKPPVAGEPGARTLLNLLRLLGTEHRWCEDPIESAPFN